jgi:hypothetical protein
VAFDPVPLAIGNGALHSDDVWRVAANAFSRDAQGIVLPGQMKVTALGTPGPAVSVAPGGVLVRNVQSPGQSYVGRAGTATQVAIAPNNSGAVRRDLIIARIIDPDFAPWQPSGSPGAPNVSVADGPYFEPFVVSGVASNVTRASQVVSYSAVALARVDVPATTTNITSAMIVDCRELAQPRVAFAYDVQTAAAQTLTTTLNSAVTFPSNSLQVYVPRWATHAQVSVDFTGLVLNSPGIVGDGRVDFGGTNGPWVTLDANIASGQERTTFITLGEFLVTAVADTTVTLTTEFQRRQYTGIVSADTRTLLRYDVRFSERVI